MAASMSFNLAIASSSVGTIHPDSQHGSVLQGASAAEARNLIKRPQIASHVEMGG